MIMDMLDGRVARLMKATSQFGVEFDSLADVVSFCVAPGVPPLLASRSPTAAGRPGSGPFLFVICGALRLARFNVQTGTVDKRFFVGLAHPGCRRGGRRSSVILLQGEELTPLDAQSPSPSGTYVLALLMVSTFRYWSFKEIDFARRRPLQTLLVVVLAVMIVATKHEIFLFLLFVRLRALGTGPPAAGRDAPPRSAPTWPRETRAGAGDERRGGDRHGRDDVSRPDATDMESEVADGHVSRSRCCPETGSGRR